jgi:hypothetical protein
VIIPDFTNSVGPAVKTARDGDGARNGSSGDGAAWLREMEKQQMSAWLSHGVLPPAPAGAPLYARIAPAPVAQHAPGAGAGRQTGADAPARADAYAARDAQDAPAPRTGSAQGSAGAAPAAAAAGVSDAAQVAAGAPVRMPAPSPAAPLARAIVDAVLAQRAGAPAAPGAAAPAGPGGAPPVAPAAAGGLPMHFASFLSAPAAQGLPQPQAGDGDPALAAQGRSATSRTGAHPGAAEPLPPLRIHAAWTDGVVRVWIGADQGAGLAGAQLLAAVQDLRRLLREQGATLESVTYNGEALPDAEGTARQLGHADVRRRTAARTQS